MDFLATCKGQDKWNHRKPRDTCQMDTAAAPRSAPGSRSEEITSVFISKAIYLSSEWHCRVSEGGETLGRGWVSAHEAERVQKQDKGKKRRMDVSGVGEGRQAEHSMYTNWTYTQTQQPSVQQSANRSPRGKLSTCKQPPNCPGK